MNRNGIDRSASRPQGIDSRAAVWLTIYLAVQIGCQLLLMVPALSGLRIVFRSAAFIVSVVFFFIVPGREQPHPAKIWLLLSLFVVAVGLFHPTTNSVVAGMAQIALYVAIAAPMFWVTRLNVTEALFRRLMLALWLFHCASAGVGALQMHYPGRFQPAVSSTIEGMGEMADIYKMTLADGSSVWRPMGLTDMPGGAAVAGLYAVIFSLGIYLQYRSGLVRTISILGFSIGFFCLYIGQIRSLLVMAVISIATLAAVIAKRGELGRYFELTILVPLLAIVSFFWAARIGGHQTVDRVSTLTSSVRFDEVYAKNRGGFLMETVTELIPNYPLGAGLGRWGMMRGYFGDPSNADSPPIWVEIQLTAWTLDGGIPLIVLYGGAIFVAVLACYRLAVGRRTGPIPIWASLVFALNVASIAVTFNYPLFIGQGGMEFWFLNAAVFMCAVSADRHARMIRSKAAAEKLPRVAAEPAQANPLQGAKTV